SINHAVNAATAGGCEICDTVGTMSLQPFSHSIADNVSSVRRQIAAAARGCGRDPTSVHLVAVSKTRPAGLIRQAALAGCRDFGENYLQDAVPKIEALAD